jgi:uncharacterized protein
MMMRRHLCCAAMLPLALLLAACQPDDAGTDATTSDQAGPSADAAPEQDNRLLAITDTVQADLGGESFTLAVADDGEERTRGLGGVPHIPDDRGMIFIFPRAAPRSFIMRDCLVDIDIAYLTDSGFIGRMYTMPVEPPRGEGEGVEGDFANRAYESRLKRYPSGFPCRIVIEVAGGTFERLGLRPGDRIDITNLDALKSRAR